MQARYYTERCPTGVPGFDEITQGGFIRGSLVLLAGAPGTGKSAFAARFLYEGAMRWGEPGVYVSFAETKNKFYAFMRNFNMDFEELEKKGLFKFLQLPTTISREAISSFMEILFNTIISMNAKRLVIDSITPIAQVLGPIETRATLHNALYNLANLYNVTIIMIQDIPIGSNRIGYGVEEFIVDAVIVLNLDYKKPGAYRRYMNILKFRGTWISDIAIEYSIVSGIGFILHPPVTFKNIYVNQSRRLKTHIKGLDELLRGGLVKGSSTLVEGVSGSGKTLLTLTIAAENVLHGGNVFYLSFDEPSSQLKETLKLMGYNVEELERKGLKIICMDPYDVSPGKLRWWILQNLVLKDTRLVSLVTVDGLSALQRIFDEKEFTRTIEELVMNLKNEGISTILNLSLRHGRERSSLETLVDNVILIDLHFEGTKLERRVMLLKSRMNIVKGEWHRLVLDQRGRPVIEPL